MFPFHKRRIVVVTDPNPVVLEAEEAGTYATSPAAAPSPAQGAPETVSVPVEELNAFVDELAEAQARAADATTEIARLRRELAAAKEPPPAVVPSDEAAAAPLAPPATSSPPPPAPTVLERLGVILHPDEK